MRKQDVEGGKIMKSGMVKRMLAAALAATLIVTSAGTTDVWAAGSEETVSVSVEETEESTENVKTASSRCIWMDIFVGWWRLFAKLKKGYRHRYDK